LIFDANGAQIAVAGYAGKPPSSLTPAAARQLRRNSMKILLPGSQEIIPVIQLQK